MTVEMYRQLAAANALLGRIPDYLLMDCPVHSDLMAYKRAHLSSQPAAPDTRDAEIARLQAHRDSMAEMSCEAQDDLEAEVARLKEALAAAERLFLVGKSDATLADWTALLQRAEVAEARCQDYVTLCDREREMRQAAEARVRELEAERWKACAEGLKSDLMATEKELKTAEQKLAGAERQLQAEQASHDRTSKMAHERIAAWARAAAEARARELEAELAQLKKAVTENLNIGEAIARNALEALRDGK